MNRHDNILIIGLTVRLFACNSSSDRQKTNAEKTVGVESVIQTDAQTEIVSVKDLRVDCTRGQAEPIVKKSVFPKTTFIVQADSLTAIETIDFDNGDQLRGCEYYTLTFRFETSRFQDETSNLPFWYKKSVLLVSELYKGIDAPKAVILKDFQPLQLSLPRARCLPSFRCD